MANRLSRRIYFFEAEGYCGGEKSSGGLGRGGREGRQTRCSGREVEEEVERKGEESPSRVVSRRRAGVLS